MARVLTSVPNLKEIATVNVAVALWNHIDMPYAIWRRYKDYEEWRYFRSKVPALANDLLLPKNDKALVQKYARKLLAEMDSWVTYHHRMIFFKQGSSYELYCLVGDLVWYPNGTIDCKKTALSLQRSLRLSELHKFRLLSVYCLVEEIEQLWPRLFESRVIDCAEFADYPLIYYWKCYCRNELNKVPVTVGLTINSAMFRNGNVDNWPAKEYFFDRMNVEEQIQNAIWIIDQHGVSFQKIVLMKLTHNQRSLVYVDRAWQILANYCSNSYSGDILKTWLDLKDLINEDQFVSIIRALFAHRVNDSIVTEIWITASDKFKHFVLNWNNGEYTNKIWNCWIRTYNNDSFVMLIDVSANIRSEIRSKKIFYDYCFELLLAEKLSMLERVLNLCFPRDQELAAFKLSLTKNRLFQGLCERLIDSMELLKLEKLLTFCFCDANDLVRFIDHLDDDELITWRCYDFTLSDQVPNLEKLLNLCFRTTELLNRFKKDFVAHRFFYSLCQQLIETKCFPALTQLLDLFFNQTEQLIRFKRDFVENECFMKNCKNLIIEGDLSMLETLLNYFLIGVEESTHFKQLLVSNKFFINHCQKLITSDKLPKLESLSNLIFSGVEELISFKRNLTKKDFFEKHCYELITLGEFLKLNQLLIWSFPDTDELVLFKGNLTTSKCVNDRCGRYYATANSKGLNDLLKFLMSPRKDLIIEFKRKFLLSEDGFKACIALCHWSEDVLNKLIADSLPEATCDSMMDLKKKIIFSSTTIAKLQRMVRRDRIGDVKNCVEKFLPDNEDRRTAKKLIFDNLDELIDQLFFFDCKYDEATRLSWISWCLHDDHDQSLRECKRRISVDKIFRNALKKCLFETFDENGRFSRCSLKKNFEFAALDQFLKWYFESLKEIKEYKIRMIDQYENLAVIMALLNKCCHFSYWKKLTNWFFENDITEIAKFKKKHKGEKIAKFVKIVHESYFK